MSCSFPAKQNDDNEIMKKVVAILFPQAVESKPAPHNVCDSIAAVTIVYSY